MGAIGGLLGLSGGSGGTGFSVSQSPGISPQQLEQSSSGTQGSLNAQQSLLDAIASQRGLQNQSNVYNQLQNIAAGQGPNPAQAMLNQATGQNVANQAALMAGQRGAASNVGLMARQAAMQGANIQQQAAGQGATMQAQQALNAINSSGNMANTMATNQMNQANAYTQAQLARQQTLQGALNQANSAQAQLANTNLQGQQGLIGGLLSGVAGGASMASKAKGGLIDSSERENFALGGSPPMEALNPDQVEVAPTSGDTSSTDPTKPEPQSYFAKALKNFNPQFQQDSSNPGAASLKKGASAVGKAVMMAASHGGVMEGSGFVPGRAEVSGDSYKNDKVKTWLSPGEIVIPRSVVNSRNPIRGSAEFVRKTLAKKGRTS